MIVASLIGFAFGFVGSMPIAGPIAVLVFAAGVDGRVKTGLYIGLGCAVAEAAYAAFAFWGFGTLLAEYPFIVPTSRALAAVILILLGLHFVRRGDEPPPPTTPERRAGSFAVGFSITAMNPTLLGTWAAATATLFSTGLLAFEPLLAAPFGLAAGAGIASWYVVLLTLVRRFQGRARYRTLNAIVRVMGVCLVGAGLSFVWIFTDYVTGG